MSDNVYRTVWRRFWASILDAVVLAPLAGVDQLLWPHLSLPARLLWFAFYSASFHGYSILMHGRSGQTVGKRAVGVRVIDLSGRPLTLQQALRRTALSLPFVAWAIAAGMLAIWHGGDPHAPTLAAGGVLAALSAAVLVVEIACTLFSKKRRALHDLIAGSVVVRVRKAAPAALLRTTETQ